MNFREEGGCRRRKRARSGKWPLVALVGVVVGLLACRRGADGMLMVAPSSSSPAARGRESVLIRSSGGNVAPVESLPSSYLGTIHHWCLERDVEIVRVPIENERGLGFVYPRSLGELWIPEGCPKPEARAGIAILVQNGTPRYLMPAVDTFVESGGHFFRNRGLNSQPFAHVWQKFGEAVTEDLRLHMYTKEVGRKKWECVCRNIDIKPYIKSIIEVLADPPGELKEGMYFLVLAMESCVLPEPGGHFRTFLAGDSDFVEDMELAAREESELDSFGAALAEQQLPLLDCEVISVASADDAISIPEAYKRLYL